MNRRRAVYALVSVVGLAAVAALAAFLLRDRGDAALKPFARGKPAYPIVFTSRTDPASLRAAAAVGDYGPGGAGLRAPGAPQWQAREGRLRVLLTSGGARELTWGKPLPDGGTLIDVMSPSVSPDGRTVVFAGRRADGHGRFRLYAVDLDGDDLRPLTGGPDDPGAVALPPARLGAAGAPLPDDDRRRTDFDDVDPVILPNGVVVFASSRLPDLGGRGRRATQLWIMEAGQPLRTLTASRANDRWPHLMSDRAVAFTVWSRQDEVISADGTGLVRHDPPAAGLTAPTDRWFGAAVAPTGEQFCQVVKVREPVWRVRPLFNAAYAFMTPPPGGADPFTPANEHPERGPLAVAQADQGRVSSAPSALAAGAEYPRQAEPAVRWAPHATADGRAWSLATPSPLPPDRVLVAAAPVTSGAVTPGGYGIYELPEGGWGADRRAVGDLKPLFDDPDLVDAEPVAVYRRPIDPGPVLANATWSDEPVSIPLAGGKYLGPAGRVHNLNLYSPETGNFPGQATDAGGGRLVPPFPPGSMTTIAFYVARRDRFDDPTRPVVPGPLERLTEVPVIQDGSGGFDARMPTGDPTLLLGLGPTGKVASVTGAPDSAGRSGTFYAFAGDHVSGVRPGGYHFCTGCHTGHTFNPVEQREKAK